MGSGLITGVGIFIVIVVIVYCFGFWDGRRK